MPDNIPIEIQMEIVKRVPVKSLLQFRSVAKSWKTMIDSPQFIADYNASDSRPQHLLIQYHVNHYRRFLSAPSYVSMAVPSYVCIVDDDTFPQSKFHVRVSMAVSFEHLNELTLVGISQGLLCFLGEYRHEESDWEMAFIWNPAIFGKSIAIDVRVSYETYTTVLGFGVCPNTNEPMLVRIHDKDLPFPVEIFTLRSKEWRWLHSNLPCRSMISQSHVAIDRFIYWQTNSNSLIVSFDMTSEEFSEINLPQSLASTSTLAISKLRESLVMLEHYMEAENPVCVIWMMEHGVSQSFTKLFTVTTPNVLGFRKNGDVIWESKMNHAVPAVLEVYEPRSEVIKVVGIYGERRWFFIRSYTETLLLLDQADNQYIRMKLQ